jgi:hypothetical protein
MRDDQIQRLQTLAEDICEVFLEESDPAEWSGSGQPLASLDKEERGNRYWDKKNAIQTGSLLARVLDLRDRDASRSPESKTPTEDAEAEIKRYEKKARDLLRVVGGTHGKAAG